MNRKLWLTAGAASMLLLGMSEAPAYAQATTAAISGVVKDAAGAPVAHATVTAVHGPSGTKAVTQTDAAGVFDLRGLRIGGPYQVTATGAGFEPQTIKDINLAIGDVQRVQLSMAPAGSVSEVVVTAARASTIQLVNPGSRTTLRRADIEAVVSPKRDIRDVARRDPLAQLDFVNRSTGPSGGLYIAGSLPRSNLITIDGVRSADSYGLNTGGLSTNRGPISFEAIDQITVQAAPFDVEYGSFTGGALNIILRSGSNDIHGSAFLLKRDTRLAGTQLPVVGFVGGDVTKPVAPSFAQVANPINEQNYGFFLSGPILKDKLFIAGSYEKYHSQDATNFGPFGAGYANTFNKIPNISTGNGATAADIATVLAPWSGYAASSKLPPGNILGAEPIDDMKTSVKIDYNIVDGQRLTATFRHAESSVWKRSPSATFLSLDTNSYVQPENEDNYALQLNSHWTPELSTEARATYRGYQRGQKPPEGQGFANVNICTDPTSTGTVNSCTSGVPQVQFGPDQFRQANVLKTKEHTGEFVANYRPMWAPNNLVKLGYQYRGMDIYNLFLQQAHGVYYFDSVADFAAGRANQLQLGNALDGVPADSAAKPSYQVHSGFLQDTLDINNATQATVGLRYDRYVSSGHPTLNPNFVNRYGFSNSKDYDGLDVLMPRGSVKYHADWFDIAAGAGLVSGGLPDVFIGNSYGATTGALTNAINIRRNTDGTYTDLNTNTTVDPTVGASLLNINKSDPSWINTIPAAAQTLITADSANRRNAFTNSLAPNFKMPSDWKGNLSFKAHKWDFDFGIDFVATQSNVNIAFRDIRARLLTINGVQQYTPDGRIRYDGLVIGGSTPAAVNAARASQGLPVATNPDLANLGLNGDIQAYNPSEQNWTRTVAFSVGRQWKGFEGFLSYTVQDGSQYGGITEFATTEGGNTTSGAFYPDQSFDRDPNAPARGRLNNEIQQAFKANLSYKFEPLPGWMSRFTLFAERHTGRPISFLMSDPTVSGGRSPAFGVSSDSALVYVPDLKNPDPANPLKFTTGNTTVYFDSAASLQKFQTLVSQFKLPMGKIVPRGFGTNPDVDRLDFQYAQDIPIPIRGHQLQFTMDIANLGNLLNKNWGVVKEYTGARSGGTVVNAQCANAAGVAAGAASATCATYRYSYTTANPTTLATPTIDQQASLWSLEFGLKYRF